MMGVKGPERAVMPVLAMALMFVGACGDIGDSGDPGAPGGVPIDFAGRGSSELGDGWTVARCEGDAPLFCVARDDSTRGVVELLRYPVAEQDAIREVLDSGGSEVDALTAHVAGYHEVFLADRPQGCGREYSVATFGPREAKVAGLDGVVYGFDGRQDGRMAERNLQFAAIDGPALHIVATSAVEQGSCLDDGEGPHFSIDDLREVQVALERAVAASRLR